MNALQTKALQLYSDLPEDMRAIIKFGMTPADSAATLQADFPDASARDIALAFMSAAELDGGMVA